MAGINKKGNTQRVQKQQIESLIDFRGLSRYKSNKVITKNFTSYISGCDPMLAKTICFLIYEAKSNNIIEFDTSLLNRYKAFIVASVKQFDGSNLKRSLMVCRTDFQKVIAMGILIPIVPEKKLFLINPALVYNYVHYNQQAMFMKQYESLYTEFAVNLINKKLLHIKLVNLGRNYYNRCLNN